jgi:hypothetical protein
VPEPPVNALLSWSERKKERNKVSGICGYHGGGSQANCDSFIHDLGIRGVEERHRAAISSPLQQKHGLVLKLHLRLLEVRLLLRPKVRARRRVAKRLGERKWWLGVGVWVTLWTRVVAVNDKRSPASDKMDGDDN